MSQHTLITEHEGRKVKVLMGWDRPLQGYFLVVEYIDTNKNDEYLYSNLEQKVSHPKSMQPFLDALSVLSILLPKAMIDDVKNDAMMNIGNKHIDWTAFTNYGS